MNLQNKIALVTGASRGLGLAVTEQLAKTGATVIMCARDETRLQHASDNLQKNTSLQLHTAAADLTQPAQVDAVFDMITERFGKLDICINNAGFLERCELLETSYELWRKTLDTNVTSCFLVAQHAFRLMREMPGKKAIVNISSLSGIRNLTKFPGMTPYIASKHAVIGLTEGLAVEGRPHDIYVNCVAPGSMATEMFTENFPGVEAAASPTELAKIVGYYCDINATNLTTGSVFEVLFPQPLEEQ